MLERRFRLVVFGWEGTSVRDRGEDAAELRGRILDLLAQGVIAVIVADAGAGEVAGQLGIAGRALPRGRLYAVAHGGAEVHAFGPDGRPDRIALLPAPPARTGAMAWVMGELAPALGLRAEDVLVAGGAFGPIGGGWGSDAAMAIPEAAAATFVSVGREPGGVPDWVLHLGGGPPRFRTLMAELAARGLPEALPEVFIPTLDPGWCLIERELQPAREREVAARFANANGYLGHQGGLAEAQTYLAGVFDEGPRGRPELAPAPAWQALRFSASGEPIALRAGELLLHRRMLDMRRGVWLRVWRHRAPDGRVTRIHEARFASLADRHAIVQRVFLQPENYSGELTIEGAIEAGAHLAIDRAEGGERALLVARTRRSGVTVAIAACAEATGPLAGAEAAVEGRRVVQRWRFDAGIGQACQINRFLSFHTSREAPEPAGASRAHADRLLAEGAEAIERAHAEAWRSRWEEADVAIEGDGERQRAVRFAIYHLSGWGNPGDERVSIGARGLSGPGYGGHVFWDTEIYMIPFYVYTYPEAARALLMYRYRSLDAARERARAMGYRGALYAWEAADTGEDVTPAVGVGPNGEPVPILTGRLEHHVSSAIAYAAWLYGRVTGDEGFWREAGAEMLLEVARFWASRAEPDAEGRYHIRRVIGPDEFHEGVDDDAYTNAMAQWALERAAALAHELAPGEGEAIAARLALGEAEREGFEAVARGLVTGLDENSGLFEQFSGYFALPEPGWPASTEPLARMASPLEQTALARTRAIKQADVVMLLHLLWERFPPAVREANYRYYEPLTAHASSLSPGAYGYVAARLGLAEEAWRYFRLASAIDLDNRFGNTAAGVHAAALGCLWQTVLHGFAGVEAMGGPLRLAPTLPRAWRSLAVALRYRGAGVRVFVRPERLEIAIRGPEPLPVELPGEPVQLLAPGLHRASRKEGGWRWTR